MKCPVCGTETKTFTKTRMVNKKETSYDYFLCPKCKWNSSVVVDGIPMYEVEEIRYTRRRERNRDTNSYWREDNGRI